MLTAAATHFSTERVGSALPVRNNIKQRRASVLRTTRSTKTCRSAVAGLYDSKTVALAVEQANQQWLQHAINNKLVDAETGVTVVLLGVCFFAPMQHQPVQAALQQLSPDYIAIEQPLGTATNIVLPHPLWIQTLLDHQDDVLSALQASTQPGRQPPAAPPQHLQQIQQHLQDLSHPTAKVGRDIIDPWETFGYYGGLDLTRQPAAVITVLQLCGFLPGHELLLAAQHAMQTGAILSCVDAPIKLQESWVKQLLDNFTLDEQQVNAYKPAADLQDNEHLLPQAAVAWDQQLGAVAQQLQAALQPDAAAAAAAAQQGQSTADAAAAEQQALLLFKVSKAAAAAMLSPGETGAVIQRLQRLQPLKWAHFALRQRYMARQIKEVCAAAARAAGKQPLVAVRQQQQAELNPAAAAVDSANLGRSSSSSQSPDRRQTASGKPVTVLAIVGRQHVHGLHAMWNDPSSSLWRDRMPRSFATSVVEPTQGDAGTQSAATATAATADGSSSPSS